MQIGPPLATPRRYAHAALLAITVGGALVGCGGGGGDGPGADLGAPVGDAGPSADLGPGHRDGAAGDGGGTCGAARRFTLAAADWTLAPFREDYLCVVVEVAETTFVHEIHPTIPEGTHHTTVTLVPASTPVGTMRCSGLSAGPRMIYGSGVGTGPLTFPDGVAVRLPAGQKVMLNLHLFNTGEAPLSGRSGIDVVTMCAEDVREEAEMSLAGKDLGLRVAARSVSTQSGRCTMTRDATLFALMPHMHQTGSHMRVELARAAGGPRETVFDEPYDFDMQYYRTFAPALSLRAGDRLHVTCTYDNPGEEMGFGESTEDEMCYAGIYVYPAGALGTTCTD
jgi:hypothetical protein